MFNNIKKTLLLLMCLCTIAVSIPDIFKKCKLKDNECIKSSIEYAVSKLGDGSDELQIKPLEGLVLGDLEVQPMSGPISLYQKYLDNQVYNLTKISDVRFDLNLDTCQMFLETLNPTLYFEARYIVNGKVLFLEIDAEGAGQVIAQNTTFSNTMTCKKYTENNQEYIKVTQIQSTIRWGSITIKFGNITKGNNKIIEQVNNILAEDPSAYLSTVQPGIEKLLGQNLLELINKIFTKYPLKELFEMD